MAEERKQTKFSPLTIALFVLLILYVAIMVILFLWVGLTASKAYYGDYFDHPTLGKNIIGLPLKFMLFENIAEINTGFADGDTLISMAGNTILYSAGCALFKVVVTCVVLFVVMTRG